MFSWGHQKKKHKWPFRQPSQSLWGNLRTELDHSSKLLLVRLCPVPPASPGCPQAYPYPSLLSLSFVPKLFSFLIFLPTPSLLFSALQKSLWRWANVNVCLRKRVCGYVHNRVWLLWPHRLMARQTPLSMNFSRQEFWSGFPPPGNLSDPGIESGSLLHDRQTLYHLSHQGSHAT